MSDRAVAFSLLDEPWIRVRFIDGDVDELSLLDVVSRAREIRRIAGELPTQDVALLRMLVAVVYAATRPTRVRNMSDSLDLWESWWESESLPETVAEYLETHRNRFNLFDAQYPFFQVAGLHTDSGKASGLTKLIADVPAGHQYFTTRAGAELESISFAEAARWLVHCHAFDIAGIKTGAAGDARVKGGKGYSMGYPAFAGTLGVLTLEGANLFQTILLNCPLGLAGDSKDAPMWERELTSSVAENHAEPSGPADLLTWPSRRVRLFAEAHRVVNVQISNGDPLGPQNQQGNEPMSSWRKSPAQTKRFGKDVYMPVTHSPERRIWQGLEPLLVSTEGSTKRAAVLEWLAELRQAEIVSPQMAVALRTVGLEYGVQASSVVGAIDDGLVVGVAGLTDRVLVQTAIDGATRAKQGVLALANLASNLALAVGGDSEPPRERTFEQGYSQLDRPFRQWVLKLNDPESAPMRLDEWGEQARQVLLALGRDLIAQAGSAAIVGRDVSGVGANRKDDGGKQGHHLDSALAEIWFRSALKKALISSAPKPDLKEATS